VGLATLESEVGDGEGEPGFSWFDKVQSLPSD